MPLAPINFPYINHRGELGYRLVRPESLDYLSKPGYGYQPGWFLAGWDLDKKQRRSFALANIQLPANEIFSLIFREVKSTPPETPNASY